MSNRTVNVDVGALHQVMKRFEQWRRFEADGNMLSESGARPSAACSRSRNRTGSLQTARPQTAEITPGWEHLYRAGIVAANT